MNPFTFITFIDIKSSDNILADALSRLEILDIYKDLVEDPKKLQGSKIQQVMEANVRKIHTLDSNILHAEK